MKIRLYIIANFTLNLKTGVDQVCWYTPVINKTYHEMAEHYGTAVIPARVRKPKDKPNAEGTVGVISTWILAALRNQQFFSLAELNEAIQNKLETFNRNPFQKKTGSRLSIFPGRRKTCITAFAGLPLRTGVLEDGHRPVQLSHNHGEDALQCAL